LAGGLGGVSAHLKGIERQQIFRSINHPARATA
jgi:hypothetical protein